LAPHQALRLHRIVAAWALSLHAGVCGDGEHECHAPRAVSGETTPQPECAGACDVKRSQYAAGREAKTGTGPSAAPCRVIEMSSQRV
ncbi:MAG: hypothetical protein M3O70_10020, partial [Actinomycetota bacterium]|nr:hypothetical protein [Actinomycetota bacterium]